jgi:hypothetical protein
VIRDGEKTVIALIRLKDSFSALDRLKGWYQRLDDRDRAQANRVIADWLLSETEAKRFDAVALVRGFRITEAVPALRELSQRLALQSTPGAPFEREKVDTLLAEFE